jgi:hypothetical protein
MFVECCGIGNEHVAATHIHSSLWYNAVALKTSPPYIDDETIGPLLVYIHNAVPVAATTAGSGNDTLPGAAEDETAVIWARSIAERGPPYQSDEKCPEPNMTSIT